jgi:sec-independent protein translocase protein TatA
MMGLENPVHILIVLCVLLLLFGAKKLPELGRGVGQGMREFREGVAGRNPEVAPPALVEQREDSTN